MRVTGKGWQHVRDMLLPAVLEEQNPAKYRLAARLRLFFILPLLYGFTLYSLLRSWHATGLVVFHTAVLLWVAIAALYVALNAVTLSTRNAKLGAALSMACIATELANNEIIIFLTGVAASHAMIFIIIAVAVYRVFFDYRQGLFAAAFGTSLHVAVVFLMLGGALPPSPVQYSPDNAIALGELAEMSLAALAIGVLIAFSVINLGMNRLHRMQRRIETGLKRDLESVEQFNEQVKHCADESGVYSETMKAIQYVAPMRMVVILERMGDGWQTRALTGLDSQELQGIVDQLGRQPDGARQFLLSGCASGSLRGYIFPLEMSEGSACLVVCCEGGEGLDEHRAGMLSAIARSAGGAVSALRRLSGERMKAYTDALTGLHNKRYFMERWQQWLHQAAERREPFCVAMFDIDQFKQYNDAYGHLAGDDLLRLVAGAIAGSLRDGDAVARFGGEEFVVVFFHASVQQGAQVAQRVCMAVQAIREGRRQVTLSGGVACFPEDSDDPDTLLECADRRLYEAKKAGRNQICWEVCWPATEEQAEGRITH